ncbi:MAG: hypothetical protein F6K61_02865 [Sphaerospermopsis sp. SIO1G1]|nr:hypothetical protein [Sphaerospermopsis sp. SIO1G1]
MLVVLQNILVENDTQNRANTCPYCGGSILRHIRHGELYWFCSSCRKYRY